MMRVWLAVVATMALAPMQVSAEVRRNPAPVWQWSAMCPLGSDQMRVDGRYQGKRVFTKLCPICKGPQASERQRPLAFFFTAPAGIFGDEFAALGTQKIEGNIWQAGGEGSGILLGVSFTAPK